MAFVIDGTKARDHHKARLMERVQAFTASAGYPPRLAIIQIGDNKDSSTYIEQKKRFGASVGAAVDHIRFLEDVPQAEVAERVAALNADARTHGIIIQLPIPAHLDKQALINLIDAAKDVDGLTDANQSLLDAGAPRMIPATAKGVMLLLDFYGIDCRGKAVAVWGRSRLVGHPIAELLRSRGARVSVIHSQTPSPEVVSRAADIVIAAIGRRAHLGTAHIKPGAVVIDIGTQGDVDHAAVESVASAMSPVPGGVGPMTVLSLFDNLMVSAALSS
ncbi:MAG TPA: bifunctional 5,10-methylenetetrahydrofolate dehydrogenase/5,10-methenyltetrahydrofolate cyclohydrolase [Candidatus Paceibacterota bacterium]|nr:bifunctional 5,10-methylenetetrahydrofolate dehydrogenase/5,10-methenyltetrahydrofolate cyclohydrolase [Candidatus Paceibacterota bacterium]